MSFEIVVQICRLALVGAFVAAGIAKLSARDRTRTEFTEIGVPYPKMAAWAVPIIELIVAVALALFPAWGAIAAFTLLTGFTTTLLSIIKSGRTVRCACFGAIATAPVGKNQVYRNLALMAMALVVALAG